MLSWEFQILPEENARVLNYYVRGLDHRNHEEARQQAQSAVATWPLRCSKTDQI